MERGEIIESIVSEYDLETGFIGQIVHAEIRPGGRAVLRTTTAVNGIRDVLAKKILWVARDRGQKASA